MICNRLSRRNIGLEVAPHETGLDSYLDLDGGDPFPAECELGFFFYSSVHYNNNSSTRRKTANTDDDDYTTSRRTAPWEWLLRLNY